MREINLPKEIKTYLNNYIEDAQILEKMKDKPITIIDLDKFIENFPFILHSQNAILIYNVDKSGRRIIKRLNLKYKNILLFQDYTSVADFYYAYILSNEESRIKEIIEKAQNLDYPILKSIEIEDLNKKNSKSTNTYFCYCTIDQSNSQTENQTVQFMLNIENYIKKYCKKPKDIIVSTPKAKFKITKAFINVKLKRSLVN